MIPEKVTLLFDPKTANQEIRAVFAHDLARTIWLAVKSSHLASQHFNSDCLHYAKAIEKMKAHEPLTAEQLLRVLSGWALPPDRGIIGQHEHGFADELLPFVNGEKTLVFEVKLEEPPDCL